MEAIKGPWSVHLTDETLVIDAEGNEVASMHGDYDTEYEGMAARAELIAAAPEMRAAIKEKLAADDAMLAFILNATLTELGEEEWQRQHKVRAARGRAATDGMLAALARATR